MESTETAIAVLQMQVARIQRDAENSERVNDARHAEMDSRQNSQETRHLRSPSQPTSAWLWRVGLNGFGAERPRL